MSWPPDPPRGTPAGALTPAQRARLSWGYRWQRLCAAVERIAALRFAELRFEVREARARGLEVEGVVLETTATEMSWSIADWSTPEADTSWRLCRHCAVWFPLPGYCTTPRCEELRGSNPPKRRR